MAKEGAYASAEEIGTFLLDVSYGSGILPGVSSVFTAKFLLKGYEVLMVLQRKAEGGPVEVAYFGSETLEGVIRKARKQLRSGEVKWTLDKWANRTS